MPAPALPRRATLQLGGAALAAGALGRPALAQSAANTLRFVPHANLQTPDALQSSTLVSLNAASAIWDQLFGLDSKLVPRPQMVASYELSDDRLRWRFRLREGLAFHDGEPVRAADCVASIHRWSQRDLFGKRLAAQLDEMRASGDKEFEIRLKQPYGQLLYGLGATACYIMPERVARTPATTTVTDFTGSGPFRFLRDEWVSGASVAFARNEKYVPRDEPPDMWAGGKVAKLARIEWKILPDPATAVSALQSGEVDWLERPLADLLPVLRGQRGLKVETIDPIGVWSEFRLNDSVPPFDNPALRRALLPAVRQVDYMQSLVGGNPELYRTGAGVFLPGSAAASTAGLEAITGERSLERARQMVKQAGYAGEAIVQMAATDLASSAAMSPVAQQMLRDIGFNVDYQSVDWGTLISRANAPGAAGRGGWHCYCTGWAGLWVSNPGSHLHLYGTRPNPRMEALRDAWFAATEAAEQRRITEQMQLLAFEEPPFLPLGQYFTPQAYSTKLSGFIPSPVALFWNLEKSA
ncbi:ABC transporter substrate-binding protein [Roseomonas sp. E05]|uniref:ABC transporter substrate-binding protein n=1 Tax=Roseomonas sp. E05 TaxID=3046310 RepID=UPI0024BAE84C|nr:ABC transporter substrate-binding protein [Roseomonas sp. E05]MDJ0387283.1 ABC transporter substrate-binding protein [Roseomonas sp. E05]